MWLKQCHKPLMTGNGSHTTYKHRDDWRMVYGSVLTTLCQLSRVSLKFRCILIPIENLVGGFNPYEKYESQLGWLLPIYGKIKFMFQTTTRNCLNIDPSTRLFYRNFHWCLIPRWKRHSQYTHVYSIHIYIYHILGDIHI